MKKLIVGCLAISSLSLFSSCSKVEEMSANAEAAKDNSGRAADAAGESRLEIANSRLLGRAGASRDARRKALHSMMEMKSFEMKVTEASTYLKAFEFQLWTGQLYDTPEALDAFKKDAASEFFRSLTEVYGDQRLGSEELSPVRVNATQRDLDLNILALSVALHGLHNYQSTGDDKQRAGDSMMSLIKETLKKIEKVEAGEISFDSLKEYEQEIYAYRDEAIVLLRGRVDMLMTMVLCEISDIDEGFLSAASMRFLQRSFQSKFMTINQAEQNNVNKYLEEAAVTQKFLQEIGEEVRVNEDIADLFLKMRVSERLDAKAAATHEEAISIGNHEEFLGHLENFFEVRGNRLREK